MILDCIMGVSATPTLLVFLSGVPWPFPLCIFPIVAPVGVAFGRGFPDELSFGCISVAGPGSRDVW